MSVKMDLNRGITEIASFRSYLHNEKMTLAEDSEEFAILENVCMALTLSYAALLHLRFEGYDVETDGEMVSFCIKRNEEGEKKNGKNECV